MTPPASAAEVLLKAIAARATFREVLQKWKAGSSRDRAGGVTNASHVVSLLGTYLADHAPDPEAARNVDRGIVDETMRGVRDLASRGRPVRRSPRPKASRPPAKAAGEKIVGDLHARILEWGVRQPDLLFWADHYRAFREAFLLEFPIDAVTQDEEVLDLIVYGVARHEDFSPKEIIELAYLRYQTVDDRGVRGVFERIQAAPDSRIERKRKAHYRLNEVRRVDSRDQPRAEATTFVGRVAELTQIRSALERPPGRVLLFGLPGIGKTALAHTFGERFEGDFAAGVFSVFANESGLLELATKVVPKLFDASDAPTDPGFVLNRIVRELAERTHEGTKALVVLDDVIWSDRWAQLAAALEHVRFVATARTTEGVPEGWATRYVDRMSAGEIADLAEAHAASPVGEDEQRAYEAVVEGALGGKTDEVLYGIVRASRMGSRGDRWQLLAGDPAANIKDAVGSQVADVTGRDAHESPRSILKTHVELARRHPAPEVWRVLRVLCCVDRKNQPVGTLRDALQLREISFRHAIDELRSLALVSPERPNGDLEVHQRVWEDVRARIREDELARDVVEPVVAELARVFTSCVKSLSFTALAPLSDHAGAVLELIHDAEPSDAALVLGTRYARYLRVMNRADHAVTQYDRVLTHADRLALEDWFEAVIQRAYSGVGDTRRATALALIEGALGSPRAQQVLHSADSTPLVEMLIAYSDFLGSSPSSEIAAEGLSIARLAVELAEHGPATSAYAAARSRNMLGLAYARLADYDAAEREYRAARATWGQVPPPLDGHPARVYPAVNLAYRCRGRARGLGTGSGAEEHARLLVEAIDCYEEAIRIEERSLGGDHPSVAVRSSALATTRAEAAQLLSDGGTLTIRGQHWSRGWLADAALSGVRGAVRKIAEARSWLSDRDAEGRELNVRRALAEILLICGDLEQAADELCTMLTLQRRLSPENGFSSDAGRVAVPLCARLRESGKADAAARIEAFYMALSDDQIARSNGGRESVALLVGAGQSARAEQIRARLDREAADREQKRATVDQPTAVAEVLERPALRWLRSVTPHAAEAALAVGG